MDITQILSGLGPLQSLGLALLAAAWLALTFWLGNRFESKGGDRESGVLLGFGILGLLVLLVCWPWS